MEPLHTTSSGFLMTWRSQDRQTSDRAAGFSPEQVSKEAGGSTAASPSRDMPGTGPGSHLVCQSSLRALPHSRVQRDGPLDVGRARSRCRRA